MEVKHRHALTILCPAIDFLTDIFVHSLGMMFCLHFLPMIAGSGIESFTHLLYKGGGMLALRQFLLLDDAVLKRGYPPQLFACEYPRWFGRARIWWMRRRDTTCRRCISFNGVGGSVDRGGRWYRRHHRSLVGRRSGMARRVRRRRCWRHDVGATGTTPTAASSKVARRHWLIVAAAPLIANGGLRGGRCG